jgi:hypothetical protein
VFFRIVLFLFVVTLPLSPLSSTPASDPTGYSPDIDLTTAPASYRKRVLAFRNLLRKETTREAKVKRAIALAKDPASPYIRDAVDFLASVRAKEGVPLLLGLCRKEEVREFAIHALGEIRDARAMPTLIEGLSDESENVRGNAHRAIEKTARKSFSYRYDDPKDVRALAAERIGKWWKENEASFRVEEFSAAETAEADSAWQKYGREYLKSPTR